MFIRFFGNEHANIFFSVLIFVSSTFLYEESSTIPGARNPVSNNVGSCKTVCRFHVIYFLEVIHGLDGHKKRVIRSYGFGSLLDFDGCSVPLSFACWILTMSRSKYCCQ